MMNQLYIQHTLELMDLTIFNPFLITLSILKLERAFTKS